MRVVQTLLVALILITAKYSAHAQADELAQLALNIEKLAQFKQILSDLKKGYQIVSTGYGTIKDISEGNFSIHKTFLDGLYAVSPEVRKYRKIGEIINYQIVLVREYKSALGRFKQTDLFQPSELDYMQGVYKRLFDDSMRNLEQLTMIITAGQLRMSDDERLSAIDSIHTEMQDMISFLRSFNNQTSVLAIQRQKEQHDIQTSKKLNGLNR